MGKRAQNKVRKVEIIRTTGKSKPTVYRRPETTPIWQRLEKVQIKGKQECLDAFLKISKDIENGKYKFEEGSQDMGKYFVVNETERQGSSFVHIVPSETYKMFEEMRKSMPTSFLGFSMLSGKIGKKDLRVSCFAIPTSEITRAMISRK